MLLIIGLLLLIIMGILVKVFDEQIRQRKMYKQLIVYMFFAGVLLCLIGFIQILLQ